MSKAICSIEGCRRPVKARGWCASHYQRWRKHGDPGTVLAAAPGTWTGRTCSVAGCAKPVIARGWCSTHWARWRKHGDPLIVLPFGPPRRTADQKEAMQRDWRLQRNYGITHERYAAMAQAQHGRCALCGCVPKRRRVRKNGVPWIGLVVDHDHASGQVRGLLCLGCNIAIGRVDRIGLEAIAAYQAQVVCTSTVPDEVPLAQRVETY